jgi:hypothetical protein
MSKSVQITASREGSTGTAGVSDRRNAASPLCSVPARDAGTLQEWVHTYNVTAYRNTVS